MDDTVESEVTLSVLVIAHGMMSVHTNSTSKQEQKQVLQKSADQL